MNYVDLFSGIGGFRLGAQWAGLEFEHEFHSDIDEYANKVYAKHFPNSIQLGDITKIDWHELKEKYKGEWIITGGFPCQDISIAGKGAGLAGSRSGLWFEIWKAISILQPRFLIAENVPAITFRGLSTVVASLAEVGYNVEWQNISAGSMGAPHERERIWVLAYPQSIRQLCRQVQLRVISESSGTANKEWPNVWATAERVVCSKLQKKDFTLVCGNDNGLSSGMDRGNRLHGLGNSIVPQIAEILFRLIREHLVRK